MAHLGPMAFPALFSLFQVRMGRTHARAHGRDTRFSRRARLPICGPACGLVVSMVDRVAARRDFCLASYYQAARDQFWRCIITLLDGRGVHSAALFGAATGLLFNEYVERVCTLGSHGLGPDSPNVAGSGGECGGCHGSDPCRRSAVRGARRPCFEPNLGSDGRPVDSVESLA